MLMFYSPIYILDAKWGAKAPHFARPSDFQSLNQKLKPLERSAKAQDLRLKPRILELNPRVPELKPSITGPGPPG